MCAVGPAEPEGPVGQVAELDVPVGQMEEPKAPEGKAAPQQVSQEEAEAQARRDAIQQQELMVTIVGIAVLLIFTFIGATGYLHYMGWLDVWDYLP